MSASSVLTQGLGSWGSPSLIITLGFGSSTATTPVVEAYSGGYEKLHSLNKRRTKKEIAEARKKYGLAFDVIESVALSQSERSVTDQQKIFDELSRELSLQKLEFDSQYLEYLNLRRAELIRQNIKIAAKRLAQEEEDIRGILMLASII